MSQKIRVKKLQNSSYVIAPDQAIGKGSFAVIVRAYNLQNPKQQLVAKIISVKDAQTSVTIKAQLQILKKLPYHPNLVNCMKYQISSENNFYLIMEYCNEGNLDKYMVRKKFNLPQQKIWFFLKQFCEGYKVLYNSGLVHRDIKPQNIMIHNGDFKIADFGLSKNVDSVQFNANMSAKGTPLYMAPQIHQQKQGSSKVDVFSLGILLYRMAFGGQYPFFDQGRKYRSINQYFKQLLIRKLIIPTNFKRSTTLINLIERMLIKDKQQRISWKQIFQMQMIKNAIRFQRKKQIAPMQQLKRSLMVVNRSQTEVKIVQCPSSSLSPQNGGESSSNIILEQTFNKTNKSDFQKTLFKNKLLYTLIQYTNTKIQKFVKKTLQKYEQKIQQPPNQNDAKKDSIKKYEKLYNHISKKFNKIVQQGILFSLYIISKLEHVSGDWATLNQGQIMNFEDIFQNDKGIFIQHYKELKKISAENKSKIIQGGQVRLKQVSQKQTKIQDRQYVAGTYQDSMYNVLSQFFEYPSQVRIQLRPIFALLVDIYDLAVKAQTQKSHVSPYLAQKQKDKNLVQKAQQQTTIQFYQYLIDIETVEQNVLKEQMHKKGLIFL